nr:hypothetical protein [Cressdnaviricota sp.]
MHYEWKDENVSVEVSMTRLPSPARGLAGPLAVLRRGSPLRSDIHTHTPHTPHPHHTPPPYRGGPHHMGYTLPHTRRLY